MKRFIEFCGRNNDRVLLLRHRLTLLTFWNTPHALRRISDAGFAFLATHAILTVRHDGSNAARNLNFRHENA